MVCLTNCALGSALIGGTLLTALMSKQDPVFTQYEDSLDAEQKDHLEKIANERMNLYIQGTVLGVVLVVLVSMFGYKRLTPFTNGCLMVVIVLVSQYFYYILMPKSDWMLRHLNGKFQNEAWLGVYRHMSVRWHIGLLIGLFGFFLLGRGLRM